ncbi:MAG: hypothetical protein A2878_01635 [Candidatus Moranbacteria bacterium RIFCSPHIGHO2_01_FULL_54_31]|nr:MAG: hypothetical protein A2878_01635 [Candidatus Moranbacteria bacterium RIFCSPHIGHO2_01_FULL_54_31]
MLNDANTYAVGWDADIAQSEKDVSFFKNTIVRTLLGANVLFIGASFGVLGYFIRPTDTLLVLHYNVYFGVEIQGIWWQTFILPIAGLLFLAGHLWFSERLYGNAERIAAYLMLFGAWLLNLGILIASASIAFINY